MVLGTCATWQLLLSYTPAPSPPEPHFYSVPFFRGGVEDTGGGKGPFQEVKNKTTIIFPQKGNPEKFSFLKGALYSFCIFVKHFPGLRLMPPAHKIVRMRG